MKFGKVIGNVVSTKKTGRIDGLRLLLVQELDHELKPLWSSAVCTDTVNANTGDIVLTCASSSARFTRITRDVCTDNSIIAIVDIVSMDKKDFYRK